MIERGKKHLVVGLGKTGIAVVRFLMDNGVLLKAVDSKSLSELPGEVKDLVDRGLEVETGPHSHEQFEWADTVILSPGVSYNKPVVREFGQKGKDIISEIEFASRFIKKPVIGITGSNGKTTTAALLADVMSANGYRVFLGGNIGTPLITIAGADSEYDYIILELSSFQLQGMRNFKPLVSTVLNISQNHLDHHADFEEYLEAKLRIFINQDENDWVVYNKDDEVLGKEAENTRARKISLGSSNGCDIRRSGSTVISRENIYDLSDIKLLGIHNLENSMTVIAIAEITGCDPVITNRVINEFKPLPHRTEYLGTFSGTRIFNDSKSTTPDSTLHALKSFDTPVVLIIGGRDKGLDYSVLNQQIKNRVRHLIIYGQASDKLNDQLCPETTRTTVNTLEEAVMKALSVSVEGDSVLFSPACSSFDMFSSYVERGREFKKIVELL